MNALWDAAPLVGDRIAVVGAGHGRLLRRGPRWPDPGRPRARWSTSTRHAREVARALGVDFALPGRGPGRSATSSCTRARRRRGCSRALDLLGVRGHRPRAELVRRPTGGRCRWGGRSTPAGWRIRASQVGTVSPSRRGRRTTADRLALALELLRDPAFDALITGESHVPRPARRDAPAGRRLACRRCATRRLSHGEELTDVQRDRPRPHDDRPQLPRRGVRPRAAAARRHLRRRRHVPPPGRSTPTASWSTSAGPPHELARGAGRAHLPQPRRRPVLRRA